MLPERNFLGTNNSGNGGGHKNASGGKIRDYRDSLCIYSEIREFIQDYLNRV